MTGILCVGLTTIDITHHVTSPPCAGKKTQAKWASLDFGGPAANAAAAAAALGAQVTLCSTVGKGPLANLAAAELAKAHVELLASTTAGQPPISSVTVCEDGSRTVVSANGIDQRPVQPAELFDLAQSSQVVLVDGHYPELALTALQGAQAAGVLTVIDLGSWKSALPDLLPLCRIAIASADFTVPDSGVFDYLSAAGVSFIAVTSADAEIVWRDRGGVAGHIPVPQVSAIDTNGAGDVLHGAFAAFLSRGASPVQALTAAAALASESCTVYGARIPTTSARQFGGRGS